MLVACSYRISPSRYLESSLIIFKHKVVSVGHSQLWNLPRNTHYSTVVSCAVYRLGAFCYHACCLKMIFRVITLAWHKHNVLFLAWWSTEVRPSIFYICHLRGHDSLLIALSLSQVSVSTCLLRINLVLLVIAVRNFVLVRIRLLLESCKCLVRPSVEVKITLGLVRGVLVHVLVDIGLHQLTASVNKSSCILSVDRWRLVLSGLSYLSFVREVYLLRLI
jgi:hypothetical protein